VVTLIQANQDENAKVFGMAYKIPDQEVDDVLKHLDYREKNGYSRKIVKFYPYPYKETDDPIDIMLYVATHDNPSYAGHKNDLNEIAEQIFHSHGQSGDNKEYVYHLAQSMRQIYPNERDDHLFALESILKEMEVKHNLKD
jgi:cation transport protein ChaC